MHIQIEKTDDIRWLHPDLPRLTRLAAEWSLSQSDVGKEELEQLNLRIVFEKHKTEGKAVYGLATSYLKTLNPMVKVVAEENEVKVQLQVSPNASLDDLLFVLFHEMVHIFQYLEHRAIEMPDTLTDVKKGFHYWANKKGQPLEVVLNAPYDNAKDYYNSPWEKEANERGRELLAKYKKTFYPIPTAFEQKSMQMKHPNTGYLFHIV